MDEKGVMVEEWKARRKEWKKKRWKKGKGKKWFWEKSFLFLFDCVFASSLFFPLHPPHHHATTHAHTHSPLTTQHDALVHTITCKQGHVLHCLWIHFFLFTINFCGLLSVNLLAACHPQSQKREVGTIALWPHARAC